MLKAIRLQWRSLAIGLVTPLLALPVSYWICVTTGSSAATAASMIAICGVGLALGIRQSLRDGKRNGFPSLQPMTPQRWKIIAFSVTNTLGGIAATFGVFALAQNRVPEGLCALAVLPGGITLLRRAYALQAAPLPAQIGTWQLASTMQFVLAIIFTANITMRLLWNDPRTDAGVMYELLVAAYFTIIPLLFANAIEMRAFYRRSMRIAS